VNFCKIHSAQATLLHAERVDIEVDISPGLHAFTIVGLPDKAVEESKDRVSSAIKNSGFISPKQKNHKIVISLAPADVKKTGPAFDVAIALGYLQSTRQIDFDAHDKMFVGELSLDGTLQKITGIVPIILFAQRNGFKEVYIPENNREEAELIHNIRIYCAKHLRDIVSHLQGRGPLAPLTPRKTIANPATNHDLHTIIGQEQAKRGLVIAATGGHNIALYGPPGTGKTMLAKALLSLLPPLEHHQIIECTGIHSKHITRPPFRNPHHTSSHTAIIGGGQHITPGEITLAHNGILLLDEFPEFNRKVIESLREPLEQHEITLARTSDTITLPSKFILAVTMNPCPCGYFETGIQPCTCTLHSINRYRRKISGPIIDRIDMWIEVSHIAFSNRTEAAPQTPDAIISSIEKARSFQYKRLGKGKVNKDIASGDIAHTLHIQPEAKTLLDTAADNLRLSVRSYHTILKLAQTICDLESDRHDVPITMQHILEALQYRPKFN
jgi:magnesium chelatase family protein